MIIYNVTVNVDASVHDEWFTWMQDVHIKDVMKTGMFSDSRMLKVLNEENGGHTYSIQYTCNSMKEFTQYEELFAPALRAEVNLKYKDKFVAFRTLLEVIS
jgi:hypothetical protein